MQFRSVKSEAIVLRKRNMLQKDSIVSLFTQEYGKVRAIAKGMTSITSRRLTHCQTGNLISAMMGRKESWYYLQDTTLISAFLSLKKDEKKVKALYLILFLLDRLLPEGEQNKEIYSLVKQYIIQIGKNIKYQKKDLEDVSNQILQTLGYLTEKKPLPLLLMYISEIIDEKVPSFSI